MRFAVPFIAVVFSCLSFISTASSETVTFDSTNIDTLQAMELSTVEEIRVSIYSRQAAFVISHRLEPNRVAITLSCLRCSRIEQQFDYFKLQDLIRIVWGLESDIGTPEHFQTALAHHYAVGRDQWNWGQISNALRQYGQSGRLTIAIIVSGPPFKSGHLDALPEFPYEVLWLKDRGFTCAWLDSITLDGYCINPLEVKGDTVFFNYITGSYDDGGLLLQPAFVSITKTCKDPRLSWWWQHFCLDRRSSLWEAVEIAALSHDLPELTSEIIDHMIRCGVVTVEELHHMTPERIVEVMQAYTALVAVEGLLREWASPTITYSASCYPSERTSTTVK